MSLTNSFDLSFEKPFPEIEEENNKADSGDELNLISSKCEKIGFLTDLNTVIESEAVIKYVDKVKYYNDYKEIKKLGEGSICKVKLVEKNNVKYALKIINKTKLLKRKKLFQDENGEMKLTNPLEGIFKEINILKKINHKNLVKLYEIIHNKKKGKIYLVLEYCAHGDLMIYDEEKNKFIVNKNIFDKFIKNKEDHLDIEKLYYSETQIRKFIRQIIQGLNYLHRNGIVHRDLKPNNILLDENNECKMIDFNLSTIFDKFWVDDNTKKKVSSNDYFRPPETSDLNASFSKFNNYKEKPVDIWAVGVIAYILSYNKFPFYSENEDLFELYEKITKAKFEIPNKPKRSNNFISFLKKCLERDPNKRITSEKILNLKWINIGEKENLKNQCKKAVKFIPSKNELLKNKAFFTISYKDLEKIQNDKNSKINLITNKVMEKVPKVKNGKKVKIKIKLKNNNKDNKEYKEEFKKNK